jgi:hypothetical protein
MWQPQMIGNASADRQTLLLTGTVARSLAAAHKSGIAVKAATLGGAYHHLAKFTDSIDELYMLANFILAALDSGDESLLGNAVTRLAAIGREERGGLYWDLQTNSLFHGWGTAGRYETTGLAVSALSAWRAKHSESTELDAKIRRGILFLLRGRDRSGLWHSTQSTVRAMRVSWHWLLAELYVASTSGRIATGRRAGHKITKAGDEIDIELAAIPGPCCANVAGVNLHAGVCIPAHDRFRLERLCRYVGRQPVALDRLSTLADGRLKYRLKRRWRDGTTHVLFEPLELIEKSAALVPAPQVNQIRYFGVLGASAGWRPLVIPSGPDADGASPSLCAHDKNKVSAKRDSHRRSEIHPRRYTWAEFLKRVFLVDVLICPHCGGCLRILCAIVPPDAIVKILVCLGRPSKPPPIFPANPDRDPEFFLN